MKATENRGKHFNRPNRISDEALTMLKHHWASIPHKKSHYSANKTQKKYFNNPILSVRILFDSFKGYYFEKTKKKFNFKYSAYYKFFVKNSIYKFRSPCTDVCDFCTSSEKKLRVNLEDVRIKKEYQEHLKKLLIITS